LWEESPVLVEGCLELKRIQSRGDLPVVDIDRRSSVAAGVVLEMGRAHKAVAFFRVCLALVAPTIRDGNCERHRVRVHDFTLLPSFQSPTYFSTHKQNQ
jgi:hypothetical protein